MSYKNISKKDEIEIIKWKKWLDLLANGMVSKDSDWRENYEIKSKQENIKIKKKHKKKK